MDPDPIDNIIIDNSNISKPKSEIIGKIIELTIIIEEVLEPWLVFRIALHKNPIKHIYTTLLLFILRRSGNSKVKSEFLIIFPNAAPIDVSKTIGKKSLNEFLIIELSFFSLGINKDKTTPINNAIIGFPKKLITVLMYVTLSITIMSLIVFKLIKRRGTKIVK